LARAQQGIDWEETREESMKRYRLRRFAPPPPPKPPPPLTGHVTPPAIILLKSYPSGRKWPEVSKDELRRVIAEAFLNTPLRKLPAQTVEI
jgi:hypothetical protein